MSVAYGRYRLLERLGEGTVAEVFKAKRHGVEGFEKTVAFKRILPDLCRNPEFVDRFVREAKLAVRLSHPNVVQVFDLGKAAADEPGAGAYYIAMEYVHGVDLATLLARCRRDRGAALPPRLAAYIAAEVARGLDHAHRRRDEQMRPLGVLHGDVSPRSVLLSFEGEVKIADFGLATARGLLGDGSAEEGRGRRLRDRLAYMSPERARGGAVDARSDLYSLGVVLYECVSGVCPFGAPTAVELRRRVQAGESPPLELFRPELPAAIVDIVRQAMAPDPADRPADAGCMYEALLAFLYAQEGRHVARELAEVLSRALEAPSPASDPPDSEPSFEVDGADPRPEPDADGGAALAHAIAPTPSRT